MVDLEMIELTRRAITPEFAWVRAASRPLHERFQDMVMFRTHLLLNAIRTEAIDRASHKQLSFIDGIAHGIARIPANDYLPGLGHERAHLTNRPLDDNYHPFHGH